MTGNDGKKKKEGVVVSDKMDKTIVVSLERRLRHPVYQRVIKRSKKVKAHVEGVTCKVGDRVRIVETRPMSKDKRWKLLEVIG